MFNQVRGGLARLPADVGLLILRVGFAGIMLVQHGLPKLMGYETMMNTFPDPLGISSPLSYILAVFAEFFCSALVIVGYQTRLATIPLISTMVVAGFIVHASDPFAKKELAIEYLVAFLAILFTGPGRHAFNANS